MKTRCLKSVGVVVLIVVMVCVVTYADKHKKAVLPAVVKTAIETLYPQAVIGKAKVEEEGLKVYEVELKQDGQEFDVTVAADGTIVGIESELAVEDIPAAVAEALAKVTNGAKITEVDEDVTYAVVTLTKLNEPQVSYEAEVTIDGKKCEVEVAADGTVLEKSKCEKDDDDEDDDEDENDEDEEQVSINDVPEAVKATILKEAEGGTIKEIESGTENGKTVYDADVIINGQEVEIKVAADGTLLSKKVEDDDENDEEDN